MYVRKEPEKNPLREFGLTDTQISVYLSVVRLGIASVAQITKESKVRREEVYRVLPSLEEMGLAQRVLGNPVKVRATPVEEALPSLIKRLRDDTSLKVTALEAITVEYLKNQKKAVVAPLVQNGKSHLTMISQWNAVNHRGVAMVSESQKEVNLITSIHNADLGFFDFSDALRQASRRKVNVRIIAEAVEDEKQLHEIMKKNRLSKSQLKLKYTNHPSIHYMIADQKEAMLSTMADAHGSESPYLWTNEENLVGILMTNFEQMWHNSSSLDPINDGASELSAS
jgi:sugar-specific transcriptional regulator TrmB